jgi:hypothetical protein
MRIVLGLLALVWLKEAAWAEALLVGVILVGLAVLAWIVIQNALYTKPEPVLRVEPRFEPWPNREYPKTNDSGFVSRIEKLEAELRTARSEVEALTARNTRLEGDLYTARSAVSQDRTNPLFRRVGLDQDAPEWVVVAVRRAYRKRLHPDGQPAGAKVEAERRFKQVEGVFEEIWNVRGLRRSQ